MRCGGSPAADPSSTPRSSQPGSAGLARAVRSTTSRRANGMLGTGLKTVETHVAAIFSKLGLEPTENDNRRVMAVVTWLRSAA